MKFLTGIVTILFIMGIFSCDKSTEIIPDLENGGIAITFDDDNVSEWYLANDILKDHNWKVTFCISNFDNLTTEEIQQLHELNNQGHEIAGHGLNHINAVDYISSFGINEYLTNEILPMIELMENEGFTINSFAYPFGARDLQTDSVLLNYFDIIRGIGWPYYNSISEFDYFYEGSPVVYGFGIDTHYPYFEGRDYEKYILDFLTYARDNNKILIIYSHIPVENITGDHQTSISTLELICRFIEENNMKYYTLSDLKKP